MAQPTAATCRRREGAAEGSGEEVNQQWEESVRQLEEITRRMRDGVRALPEGDRSRLRQLAEEVLANKPNRDREDIDAWARQLAADVADIND